MRDAEKDASLEAWMTSRLALRRLAFLALRNLAFLGYYSQPDTWPLVGYQGPSSKKRRPREADLRELEAGSGRAGRRLRDRLGRGRRGGGRGDRHAGPFGGGPRAGTPLDAADFTQREDQMMPRLFEEAGMRQTVDGSIMIMQGRNIGGSTVHNLCYAFRAPTPILRMWREEYGLGSLTPEALEPCFQRVEQDLYVKPIIEEEVNPFNALLRAGAEKLGYSGFVTKHNRENCAARLLRPGLHLRVEEVDGHDLRAAGPPGRRAHLRQRPCRAHRSRGRTGAAGARPRRRSSGPGAGRTSRSRRRWWSSPPAPWARRTSCCAAVDSAGRSAGTCTCIPR